MLQGYKLLIDTMCISHSPLYIQPHREAWLIPMQPNAILNFGDVRRRYESVLAGLFDVIPGSSFTILNSITNRYLGTFSKAPKDAVTGTSP